MATLSASGNLQYRTSASIRAAKSMTVGAIIYLCDEGKEGPCRVKKAGARDVQPVDDGAMTFVGQNGYYVERIVTDGVVLATWYDVVPDRPDLAAQNSLNINRAIEANNYCILKLPRVRGTRSEYDFGHLPGSGIFEPTTNEACISFCDRVMAFDFDLGVQAFSETGYTALQAYERYGRGYVIQKRVSFNHRGGRDILKEHGAKRNGDGSLQVDAKGRLVYGDNWGSDYQIHGFKQWCSGELLGVNYYGYPGHGGCIWGQIGVRATPVRYDVTGRIDYASNGDAHFIPDRQADYDAMTPYQVRVDFTPAPLADDAPAPTKEALALRQKLAAFGLRGISYRWDGYLSIGYGSPETTGLPTGTRVTASYYRETKDFFADFIQARPLDGLNNFDRNGGAGIFVVGAEANHGVFAGISGRNNGGPTVADWSFLGNHWPGLHATASGEHFNYDVLVMGAVDTRGSAASRASFFYGYREENQGPDNVSQHVLVIGGMHSVGVRGGHTLLDGVLGMMHATGERGSNVWLGDTLTLQSADGAATHLYSDAGKQVYAEGRRLAFADELGQKAAVASARRSLAPEADAQALLRPQAFATPESPKPRLRVQELRAQYVAQNLMGPPAAAITG